ILIALIRRRLTLQSFRNAIYATLKTTGMIFGILFGAMVFNSFVTATTIPMRVVDFVATGDFPPMVVLLLILLIYFFLGMILDASAMMTLTVPLFFPIVTSLGFDAILFGVLV